MRVIAGAAGGIQLDVPQGWRPADDGSSESSDFLQPRRADNRRAGSRFVRGSRSARDRSPQSRRGLGLVCGREHCRGRCRSSTISRAQNLMAVSASRMFSPFLGRRKSPRAFRIIFADPPYEKTKSGGEFTALLLESVDWPRCSNRPEFSFWKSGRGKSCPGWRCGRLHARENTVRRRFCSSAIAEGSG